VNSAEVPEGSVGHDRDVEPITLFGPPSLRFRQRHEVRGRKMVLGEARKREEGENAQSYGCIVGRAFFNFPPLPKFDGISTRLTRDKRVEATYPEEDRVNLWAGNLTADMETLRNLSVPGWNEYERMTPTGDWIPLEKYG